MARIFFVACFLVSFTALGQTSARPGFYHVPHSDGFMMPYQLDVEFEGDDIDQALEFTLLLPVQLVGHENRFVIKKIGTQWEGDPALFDFVECGPGDKRYDFSCEFHFNKEALVNWAARRKAEKEIKQLSADVSAAFPFSPKNVMPTQAALPSPALMVDPQLAEDHMLRAGLSADEIRLKLESTESFIAEPVGFFNYRHQPYEAGPEK